MHWAVVALSGGSLVTLGPGGTGGTGVWGTGDTGLGAGQGTGDTGPGGTPVALGRRSARCPRRQERVARALAAMPGQIRAWREQRARVREQAREAAARRQRLLAEAGLAGPQRSGVPPRDSPQAQALLQELEQRERREEKRRRRQEREEVARSALAAAEAAAAARPPPGVPPEE